MKLILIVNNLAGKTIQSITLQQESATLGRALDNDVVLQDEKKFISNHHARIDYQTPDYILTDTSTNGVILNQAELPLGHNNQALLHDRDQLLIGDYHLSIQIVEANDNEQIPSDAPADSQTPLTNFPDPFADLDLDADTEDIPTNDFPESAPAISVDSASPPSTATPSSAYHEIFEPLPKTAVNNETDAPASKSDEIDEGWFKTDRQTDDSDPFADFPTIEPGNIEPQTESTQAVVTPQPQNPSEDNPEKLVAPAEEANTPPDLTSANDTLAESNTEQLIKRFLEGAGLSENKIQRPLDPEAFYLIGKLLRCSIQGVMDVLLGRAKIKNEMHLDITMIKSAENNPIKFSVSAEEALTKLLDSEHQGYLSAQEAITEAFEDIKAHQFSVIAGMQSALIEVLQRFDPQQLEQQLKEDNSVAGRLPLYRQGQLWKRFKRLYETTAREATDNFFQLFGRAFAESYLQKSHEQNKSKNSPPF